MTETAPTSTSVRRLVVGGTALGILIVLAGSAAFAWQRLSGSGTQPHDVLPSSVIAYARIDGDPSASQKVKLLHLLKKSPELAKELGVKDEEQDLRKDLFESMLSDCDVNYKTDISPWLGKRFGAGLAKSGDTGFFAIQVSDEKAARKGIDLVAGCLGLSDPGVVFAKGYALVGEGQDDTEAAAKEAATSPLSEKAAFTEDMDSLGDPGIATAWVDFKALEETFADELGGAAGMDMQLKQARSGATALRAADNNIELTGITHLAKDFDKVKTVDLGTLPINSLLVASISGGGKQVKTQWPTFAEAMGGFNLEEVISGIEDQTGFDLPEDLETLLGDNITLVAGDRNLAKIDKLEGPEGIKDFDVAIALHSDSTKAMALANKITAKIAELTGVELTVLKTKDGAILATNRAFAKSFTEGKSLRESKSFNSVISDENSAFGGFYFDIAKAVEVARSMNAPAKDLDQLKKLNALGLSVTNDSERVNRGTLKLSFR